MIFGKKLPKPAIVQLNDRDQTKPSGFVFLIRIPWFEKKFQTEQTVNRKISGFRAAPFWLPWKINQQKQSCLFYYLSRTQKYPKMFPRPFYAPGPFVLKTLLTFNLNHRSKMESSKHWAIKIRNDIKGTYK